MDDIRSLDLNLLKALDTLLETRSVTRAAERLGLTQPAVSGTLNRLRDAFGDPLFVRAQRGIIPTSRAEALAQPLRETLRAVEMLLRTDGFDPVTHETTISIAATDYAQLAVVLPLLRALRAEAPGIRVAVRPIDVPAMVPQFEQGLLDMALITPEMATDTLRARTLFDERYVCILRQDHPVAGEPMTLDLFCRLDHAIMSHDGTQFRGATDTALEALGRHRRVVASVPSFMVLLDLLRRSDLCALLPERLLAGIGGLTRMEPPMDVPGFTKILAWHERTQHDPALAWVRGRIAELV